LAAKQSLRAPPAPQAKNAIRPVAFQANRRRGMPTRRSTSLSFAQDGRRAWVRRVDIAQYSGGTGSAFGTRIIAGRHQELAA
jgi:hypothetical protein